MATEATEHVTDALASLAVDGDLSEDAPAPDAAPPPAEPKPNTFVKLFVGGVAPELTEDALREYFQQFGVVDRVVVRHSEKNANFAFITIEGDTDKVLCPPPHAERPL